jgi:Tfp pilus assembly protein PilV
LIEVVIAMSILAVGLLTLAVMQLQALRQGAGGRELTAAATIARDQMEQMQRVPWATVAPTGWTPPPWINVPGFAAGDIPMLVERASAPGAPTARQVYTVNWRVTAVGGQPNLMNVDMRVTWNEPNRPNRSYALSSTRWND